MDNQPGIDFGDVAGFGVDVLLDPLTYLGGVGLLKGLGRGGHVLSKASPQIGRLSRVERMTSSVGDLAKLIPDDLLQTAATKSGFADTAEFLGRHGKEMAGGLINYGLPFGAPKGALGMGPLAQKIGGGLDIAGKSLRYGNIPGTDFSPGQQFARIFSAKAGGLHTPEVSPFAEKTFNQQEAIIRGVRSETARKVSQLGARGALDDETAILGRMSAEGVLDRTKLTPEQIEKADVVAEVLESYTKEGSGESFPEMLEAARELGIHVDEFGDPAGIAYFPREFIELISNHAHSLPRESYLRGLKEGTEQFRKVIADPKIQEGSLNDAIEYFNRTYGDDFISPQPSKRTLKSKPTEFDVENWKRSSQQIVDDLKDRKTLIKTLLQRIREVYTPEQRAAGGFGNHPLVDAQHAAIGMKTKMARVGSALQAVKHFAKPVDDLAESGTTIKDLLKSLELDEVVKIERKIGTDLKKSAPKPASTKTQEEAAKGLTIGKTKSVVAYHGSAEEFTQFDHARMGQRDPGYFGKGFYFSNKRGSAQQYGDVAAGNLDAGKVMKVDLDTSNFLEATPAQLREKYGSISGEKLTSAIQNDGYNGVTVTMGDSGLTEYVVFDVSSIRQSGIKPAGVVPPRTTPASSTGSGMQGQLINAKVGDRPIRERKSGALVKLAEIMGVDSTPDSLNLIRRLQVPDRLAEDIVRLVKGDDAISMVRGPLEKIFDSFTNLFKVGVLNWPARYVRDITSGTAMNVLTGNHSTTVMNKLRKMLAGESADFTKIPIVQRMLKDQGLGATAENSTEIMRQLLYTHEMFSAVQGAQGIGEVVGMSGLGGGTRELLGEFAGRAPLNPMRPSTFLAGDSWNPLNIRGVGDRIKTGNRLAATGENFSRFTDAMNRGVPFIVNLERGAIPEQAAEIAKRLQVDYSPRSYSRAEKVYLKRLFPFYSFASRMLPTVVEEIAKRPGGGIAKTLVAGGRATDEDPTLPDYIKQKLSIPLGELPDGTKRYLSTIGLMHEDTLGFAGSPQDVGLELLSRTNPLIKGPLEMITGQSFFQRGREGGRRLDDLDPPLGRTLSNIMGRDDPVRTPAVLEQILSNSPLSRLVTTARTLTDKRKRFGDTVLPGWSLVNALTGVKFTDVSPRQQEFKLRDSMAELLLAMKPLGVKRFQNFYAKPESLASMSPEQQAEVTKLLRLQATMNVRARKEGANAQQALLKK